MPVQTHVLSPSEFRYAGVSAISSALRRACARHGERMPLHYPPAIAHLWHRALGVVGLHRVLPVDVGVTQAIRYCSFLH